MRIPVEKETKQMLENIRKREKTHSINEVIRLILKRNRETPLRSMCGLDKRKKRMIERIGTHEV